MCVIITVKRYLSNGFFWLIKRHLNKYSVDEPSLYEIVSKCFCNLIRNLFSDFKMIFKEITCLLHLFRAQSNFHRLNVHFAIQIHKSKYSWHIPSIVNKRYSKKSSHSNSSFLFFYLSNLFTS